MSVASRVEAIVERGKRDLRAASCAFYVRDPIWKDDFRLVALPGVKFPGTMHGFLTSDISKKVVAEGANETFSTNAADDSSRRCATPDGSEGIASELRH